MEGIKLANMHWEIKYKDMEGSRRPLCTTNIHAHAHCAIDKVEVVDRLFEAIWGDTKQR